MGDGNLLPQECRELVIRKGADQPIPRGTTPLNQSAFDGRLLPETYDFGKAEMLNVHLSPNVKDEPRRDLAGGVPFVTRPFLKPIEHDS